MSDYKIIAAINESHKIYLVQHQHTRKIYIKKNLDIYNKSVYEYLFTHKQPGLPKIESIFEENKQLIVIEEYICGQTLLEKINEHNLTKAQIKHYMIELCTILSPLHQHNPAIVHRDIKPSNIIITSYDHVILLDFNAAKYSTAESDKDTILLGTAGYAAPEQYGFGSSTPQTDIYALGILLKDLVSGLRVPSSEFDKIIKKCTRLNPAERYKSVNELRKHLGYSDNHLSGSYQLPGFRRKNIIHMMVASAGYLLLLIMSCSLEIKNAFVTVPELWINRIIFFLIGLSVILIICNYRNIQSTFPMCTHPHPLIRYTGILLFVCFAIFLLLLLLMLITLFLHP